MISKPKGEASENQVLSEASSLNTKSPLLILPSLSEQIGKDRDSSDSVITSEFGFRFLVVSFLRNEFNRQSLKGKEP